jgi:branched-chain amino acid transport system permease protein
MMRRLNLKKGDTLSNMNSQLTKTIAILVLIAGLAFLPRLISDYWIYVLTLAFFYTVMAASWNLLGGYTGQFSLAHHTFAMFGAYGSALMMAKAGAPFWVSIPVVIVLTMILSAVLGALCLRVQGLYLALITWAFAEVCRNYIRLHYSFTGGDRGMDAPLLFETMKPLPYYYLFLVIAIVSIAFIALVMKSRVGFYLRAIRDDSIAARSMGVNIVRYKIVAFMLASGIAGMAGAFYAHSIGLISPIMGDFNEMAMIIIFVVIGGMRTQAGPVVGALSVRYLMELLREYAEIRIVILSAIVILVMRFYNGGLMELWRRTTKRFGRKSDGPVSAYEEVKNG